MFRLLLVQLVTFTIIGNSTSGHAAPKFYGWACESDAPDNNGMLTRVHANVWYAAGTDEGPSYRMRVLAHHREGDEFWHEPVAEIDEAFAEATGDLLSYYGQNDDAKATIAISAESHYERYFPGVLDIVMKHRVLGQVVSLRTEVQLLCRRLR